jgi:HEAT repeat protein
MKRRLAPIGMVLGMVLGCQGQTDSISSMLEQARDGGSLKIRQDACSRLAQSPEDGVAEALIELLSHDEHWYCAAHGLGLRKEQRAIAPLFTQLETHPSRMDKYIWALGEIGDPSVLPRLLELQGRIDASTSEGQRVEREIQSAVAKLRGEGAEPRGD